MITPSFAWPGDLGHSCILPACKSTLGHTALHCTGGQTGYGIKILKTNVLLSDNKEFVFCTHTTCHSCKLRDTCWSIDWRKAAHPEFVSCDVSLFMPEGCCFLITKMSLRRVTMHFKCRFITVALHTMCRMTLEVSQWQNKNWLCNGSPNCPSSSSLAE